MFQGLRELKAAPSRTALITITVGLITVMVTFLSSLAGGLSFQSVSALQHRLEDDVALVVEESATPTLSSSRLTSAQMSALAEVGGDKLLMAREKVGSTSAAIMNDPSVRAGQALIPTDIADSLSGDGTVAISGMSLVANHSPQDLFLDHMPVIFVSDQDAARIQHAATAAAVPMRALNGNSVAVNGSPVENITVLTGDDRWEASASYQGEQLSLSLMINLLYVISALVLGAFFMVWTMQRLRGVAISAALGASRRVLVTDSLGQAVVVLLAGISAGVGLTFLAGILLADTLPIVLSFTTLLQPAIVLLVSGIIGSALSLRPVLSVEPRAAMANA